MLIRPATLADADAIATIYGHHVLHGTGTFEEEAPPVAEIAHRIAGVLDRGWPWLVAIEGDRVIGYAYAAIFRDRAAYRYSCEDSIYIAPEHMGQGLGA